MSKQTDGKSAHGSRRKDDSFCVFHRIGFTFYRLNFTVE
jgi:hypothetical protein